MCKGGRGGRCKGEGRVFSMGNKTLEMLTHWNSYIHKRSNVGAPEVYRGSYEVHGGWVGEHPLPHWCCPRTKVTVRRTEVAKVAVRVHTGNCCGQPQPASTSA